MQHLNNRTSLNDHIYYLHISIWKDLQEKLSLVLRHYLKQRRFQKPFLSVHIRTEMLLSGEGWWIMHSMSYAMIIWISVIVVYEVRSILRKFVLNFIESKRIHGMVLQATPLRYCQWWSVQVNNEQVFVDKFAWRWLVTFW